MTGQEAIKEWTMAACRLRIRWHMKINREKAFSMAAYALKKQIPKKPYYEGDGYADGHLVYDTWECPNCETVYETEYDDYKYCPNCGQKIDWSGWRNENGTKKNN